MKFSEIIKMLRKESELSLVELAEKIGYSKAIIGFWENGQRQPTLNALIALADFFEVTIDYLAGREDESGALIKDKNGSESNIRINNSFNNNQGRIKFKG